MVTPDVDLSTMGSYGHASYGPGGYQRDQNINMEERRSDDDEDDDDEDEGNGRCMNYMEAGGKKVEADGERRGEFEDELSYREIAPQDSSLGDSSLRCKKRLQDQQQEQLKKYSLMQQREFYVQQQKKAREDRQVRKQRIQRQKSSAARKAIYQTRGCVDFGGGSLFAELSGNGSFSLPPLDGAVTLLPPSQMYYYPAPNAPGGAAAPVEDGDETSESDNDEDGVDSAGHGGVGVGSHPQVNRLEEEDLTNCLLNLSGARVDLLPSEQPLAVCSLVPLPVSDSTLVPLPVPTPAPSLPLPVQPVSKIALPLNSSIPSTGGLDLLSEMSVMFDL